MTSASRALASRRSESQRGCANLVGDRRGARTSSAVWRLQRRSV